MFSIRLIDIFRNCTLYVIKLERVAVDWNVIIYGAWWLIGRFDTFRLKGSGFESDTHGLWASPSLAVAGGASE